MFSLLFLIAVGIVVWLVVRPTPERDAAAARSWAGFHQFTGTNRWTLLYVHSVYKHWAPTFRPVPASPPVGASFPT